MDEHPKTSNHGGDDTSIDIGFDLQEAVTQRLAFLSKKTVQLNDLLSATKFTKQEICHMYRGFKQVRNPYKKDIFPLSPKSIENFNLAFRTELFVCSKLTIF